MQIGVKMYRIERQCFYKLVTAEEYYNELIEGYSIYDVSSFTDKIMVYPSIIEYREYTEYDSNEVGIITYRTYTKAEFISHLQECIKELQDD
jgi:hypothetical protein